MSATGFAWDRRDIHFVLFEQLRMHERLAAIAEFEQFDRDTYEAMIDQAGELCDEWLSPLNRKGDQQGCTFDPDTNSVRTPDGFPEAWAFFRDNGWMGVTASEQYGGVGLPGTLGMAISELVTAANPAFATYGGLTRAAANLLQIFCPEHLRQVIIPRLWAGEWSGTMCLTEADAGSAVGDNRARATPTDESGVYHLEGEKVFITAGDNDFTENIIHLVLARLPGAPNGTRGLSIFIVPKFNWEDGSRNDVRVVGIEHKMGLNGSATCTLRLGANGPCRGHLIGNPGDGMRIMFTMMNEARIAVGVQGVASASNAWLNALAYARERVQGTALKDLANADAERITIVNHPDVRRMLMTMKVSVETMRSLCYTLALRHDLAEHHQNKEEARRMKNLVDLLVPVCKSWCTDLGFEVTRLAIQTFGGYGYIQEYPVEQHMRDLKIASLYEGTNGIQAMDLVGRKMTIGGGVLFMQWVQEANESLAEAREAGLPEAHCKAVEAAIQTLGAVAMHFMAMAGAGKVDAVMLQASPFLDMFGVVTCGVHALRQARVAALALRNDGVAERDRAFYQGKLLNLDFYVANVLPRAVSMSESIRSGDESCLDAVLFT